MREPPRLPAALPSSRPVVVMLCSAGVALIGLIVSILWLVVVGRNLTIVIVGPLLAVHLDEVIWGIQWGSFSVLVAGASIMAAIEYWRRSPRGIYLHMLAIVVLLPVVSLALQGVAILVVSLGILATMAAHLKARRALIITAVGLGLTFASFFYQQMGPQIGQYGTECVPIEDCFQPLLGAGYPLQYMLDIPGITSQGSLGFEDKFRLVAFALDALFYIAMTYLGYTLSRYYHARRKKSPESEG